MWTEIICVGAGSCLGGIMRYLSTKYIQSAVAATFPWGTLAVNVVGSLIIGFVLGLVDRGIAIPPTVKLFLTVGFCGGFTTFLRLRMRIISCSNRRSFLWRCFMPV